MANLKVTFAARFHMFQWKLTLIKQKRCILGRWYGSSGLPTRKFRLAPFCGSISTFLLRVTYLPQHNVPVRSSGFTHKHCMKSYASQPASLAEILLSHMKTIYRRTKLSLTHIKQIHVYANLFKWPRLYTI